MSSSVASHIFVLTRMLGSGLQPVMYQVVSRIFEDTTGESEAVAQPLTECPTCVPVYADKNELIEFLKGLTDDTNTQVSLYSELGNMVLDVEDYIQGGQPSIAVG